MAWHVINGKNRINRGFRQLRPSSNKIVVYLCRQTGRLRLWIAYGRSVLSRRSFRKVFTCYTFRLDNESCPGWCNEIKARWVKLSDFGTRRILQRLGPISSGARTPSAGYRLDDPAHVRPPGAFFFLATIWRPRCAAFDYANIMIRTQ